jgi:integrase/recombinase XerD
MSEELFTRRHSIENHRSSPLADERVRFLRHRSAQQYSRAAIRELAFQLLVVVRRMQLTKLSKVTLQEIDVAAERWARYQCRRLRARCVHGSRKRFRYAAVSWLRFLGKLEEPETRAHRDRPVKAYESFLREERGLSEATIDRCCWHAQHFLRELTAEQCTLRRMSIRNIDSYLSRKAASGWNRYSRLQWQTPCAASSDMPNNITCALRVSLQLYPPHGCISRND